MMADNMETMIKSIIENITLQQQNLVALDKKMESFEFKISSFSNELKSFQSNVPVIQKAVSKVDAFASDLSSIYSGLGILKSEIDKIIIYHEQLKKSTNDFIKILNSSVDSLKSSQDNYISKLEEHIANQKKENIAVSAHFDKIEKSIDLSHESFKAEFDKSIKNWVESKFDANKVDDQRPVVDAIRTEIYRKLDLIMIECQNAVLKAGNVASQIPMIDKKIENIYLTLQKYEISKKQ